MSPHRPRVRLVACSAVLALIPAVAYAAGGDADPGFGAGGSAVVEFTTAPDDFSGAVHVQDDPTNGTLLAVGYAGDRIALVRMSRSGVVDSSTGISLVGQDKDRAFAAIADSQGRVLLYGRDLAFNAVLLRALPDRTLDPSFSSDGRATFPTIALSSVGDVVQDGEVIYLSGSTSNDAGEPIGFVAKVVGDALDPAFGAGGVLTTGEYAGALLIQGNQILVGGGDSSGATMRAFDSTGAVVTSFGEGGLVRLTDSGGGQTFIADAIAAGGNAVLVSGVLGANAFTARIGASGSLDASYGDSGVARFKLGECPPTADNIALDSAGRALVALTYEGCGTRAIARITTGGQLDTSFGTGGFSRELDAVRLDGTAIIDGKLLVAGSRAAGTTGSDFVVTRLLLDTDAPPVTLTAPTTAIAGQVVTLTGTAAPSATVELFGVTAPNGTLTRVNGTDAVADSTGAWQRQVRFLRNVNLQARVGNVRSVTRFVAVSTAVTQSAAALPGCLVQSAGRVFEPKPGASVFVRARTAAGTTVQVGTGIVQSDGRYLVRKPYACGAFLSVYAVISGDAVNRPGGSPAVAVTTRR